MLLHGGQSALGLDRVVVGGPVAFGSAPAVPVAVGVDDRRVDRGDVLVAEADGEIAGMIEIRELKHISMLFVDKAHHRKGIGKELFRLALERIISEESPPKSVTVHSSRFAVPFYESLGFTKTSEEKIIYGVIHIPMALTLPEGRILRREHSTNEEIDSRRDKSTV